MAQDETAASSEANSEEQEFQGLASSATTDAENSVAEASAKNEQVEFSVQALRKIMEEEASSASDAEGEARTAEEKAHAQLLLIPGIREKLGDIEGKTDAEIKQIIHQAMSEIDTDADQVIQEANE